MRIRVKAPASSANMGSGFDSLGIALGLYNTIEINDIEDGIVIRGPFKNSVQTDNSKNLIYRAMNVVFENCGYKPNGLEIVQTSNIPSSRGLGSSSACIICGMLGANAVAGRPFAYDEILNFACELEGHPDNVTPSLYGGFCTSVYENGKVYYTSTKLIGGFHFVAIMPNFLVSTKKSRLTLPDVYSKEDTVYNISRASMLTSALITGKNDLIKIACQDRIHQNYRKDAVTDMDKIFDAAYGFGAIGVYLSGSGPTIMAIIDDNNPDFVKNMNEFAEQNNLGRKSRVLQINNVGAIVSELV